jgi:hypothetical protein
MFFHTGVQPFHLDSCLVPEEDGFARCLGFRVQGPRFTVWGLGFWVQGFGFRVQGLGLRVPKLGRSLSTLLPIVIQRKWDRWLRQILEGNPVFCPAGSPCKSGSFKGVPHFIFHVPETPRVMPADHLNTAGAKLSSMTPNPWRWRCEVDNVVSTMW